MILVFSPGCSKVRSFVSIGVATLLSMAGARGAAITNALSLRDPGLGAPVGAGGDSFAQSITPDGRWVLFSSAALNLVNRPGGGILSERTPHVLNVYLYDRADSATKLISVDLYGKDGADADCVPEGISDDGRHVLFESRAGNLVPGDTNRAPDIFIRDTLAETTTLVSATAQGAPGAGSSRDAVMTPDARFVVFVSEASDLVGGDTNGIPDVFIRDMQTGWTRLVSAGAVGVGLRARSGASEHAVVTPDGRHVVFYSTATNLVAEPVPVTPIQLKGQVYRRDTIAEVTTWVSREAPSRVSEVFGPTNSSAYSAVISSDGAVVAYLAVPENSASGLLLRTDLASGTTQVIHTNVAAFQISREHASDIAMSSDGNLIAYTVNGPEPAGTSVMVWDERARTNRLVSAGPDGLVAGGSISTDPVLDPSGELVVFSSNAGNLESNTPAGEFHLYVRHLITGDIRAVDGDTDRNYGELDPGTRPVLSSATNLVVAFAAGDASGTRDNSAYDVYARDFTTGTTALISTAAKSLPSFTGNHASGPLSLASFSADGRLVAFWSWADDLVPGDTNGCPDVFVRDLVAGTNILVSVNTNGGAAERGSYEATISGDGRFVAFTYKGADMSPVDANNYRDVYYRDLQTGTPILASVTRNGVSPTGANSENPILTGDGKGLIFRSTGVFYVGGAGPAAYHRDLESDTNIILNANLLSSTRAMPDPKPGGAARRYFAFFEDGTTSAYVWDAQVKDRIYTNTLSSTIRQIAMHPSGRLMAVYHWSAVTAKTTAIYDLDAKTNAVVPIYGLFDIFSGLAFSENGRYLVYSGAQGPAQWVQVYVYDLLTGTNSLISRSYLTGEKGNLNSDMPVISPDGRFVAYRTRATDIVPSDTNNTPDLLLFDQVTQTTVRIGAPANLEFAPALAVNPVFSPNGQTLFFNALGSSPGGGDFNGAADIYMLRLPVDPGIPVFSTSLMLDGGKSWLTWPASPGVTYRVQAKDKLEDLVWTDLAGPVWVSGNQASFTDAATGGNRKFYRVIAVRQ